MLLTPKRIILLGPQGSGKGTQAVELSRLLRLPHISTGEIFRTHLKHGTPLGRRIARVMGRGSLVPDRVVNRIVSVRLNQPDCRRGFILDGYPRTVDQARFLERTFPPNLVIALQLSARDAVRRISGRRIAPDGTIYHLVFDPPPASLRKVLVLRHDDTPAVVGRRLRLYRLHTEPLITFYRERGVLQRVDAAPPIPRVTRRIVRELRALSRRNVRGLV